MFPPQGLPLPGEVLLLTDELASPADFVLHRVLAAHIKENKSSRCMILAVGKSTEAWKALAGKVNTGFNGSLAAGNISLVDVVSEFKSPPPYTQSARSSLWNIFNALRAALSGGDGDPPGKALVILDDIATLVWMGVPVLELVRFLRAVVALCRNSYASLIIRQHIVMPGEPDDLSRLLLQLCTYHIDVFPLSSGRSGTVSGQVALHAGAAMLEPRVDLVPRSAALHYRLADNNVVFFHRGTGGGVL